MATTMIHFVPRRLPWGLVSLSAFVLASAGVLCAVGRVSAGLALIPTSALAQVGEAARWRYGGAVAAALLAAAAVGTGLVVRWGL